MSAARFSQPDVVHGLTLALADMVRGDTMFSASVLAQTVAAKYPEVPFPALRVIAASVMRLYFEPLPIGDLALAGLSVEDELIATDFFAAVLQAEADALEDMLYERTAQRAGNIPNVTMLRPARPA